MNDHNAPNKNCTSFLSWHDKSYPVIRKREEGGKGDEVRITKIGLLTCDISFKNIVKISNFFMSRFLCKLDGFIDLARVPR